MTTDIRHHTPRLAAAALLCMGSLALGAPVAHAEPGQVVAHEVDQVEVAVGADRVHAHQGLGKAETAAGKNVWHGFIVPENRHRRGVG